jgi:hypothetical protein
MCIFYLIRLHKLLCDKLQLGFNFKVKERKPYVEI